MQIEVITNSTGETMYAYFNDKKEGQKFANYYRGKNSKQVEKYTVKVTNL